MAKREDRERELLESVRRGCAAEMTAQVDSLLRDGWKPTEPPGSAFETASAQSVRSASDNWNRSGLSRR